MASKVDSYQASKEALIGLRSLRSNRKNLQIIHYACEGFAEEGVVGSRRITAIAVMNGRSGQTKCFSLQRSAEKIKLNQEEKPNDEELDNLEKAMLRDFYAYVKTKLEDTWVHWEMRDSTFGFSALEHRAKIYRLSIKSIPDTQKVNLPELLERRYGAKFAAKPKLLNIARLNLLDAKVMLDGPDGAQAFQEWDIHAIEQSCQRKIRAMWHVIEKAGQKNLKTEAPFFSGPTRTLAGSIDWCFEHPIFRLGTLILSVVGLYNLIYSLLGGVF